MVIYAMHPIIYAPTPIKPRYQSLFCLKNHHWIISQIVLIWS